MSVVLVAQDHKALPQAYFFSPPPLLSDVFSGGVAAMCERQHGMEDAHYNDFVVVGDVVGSRACFGMLFGLSSAVIEHISSKDAQIFGM